MTLKIPKGLDKTLDWPGIGTAVYRVFVAGCAAGGIYAATVFASKADMANAIEPFRELPPRVQALEKVSADRAEVLKRIADWQVKKDEIDIRLTVLMENQQRQLDRQQIIIDRQQVQIDSLNARR